MYDYKLIEAYASVIQEGGFEKASKKLNITQSAVSQRVKLLEEQFGQILLQRTTPPQPTSFGRKIHRHFNQVSRLESDLRGKYRGNDSEVYTTLPIGVNADTLETWFFKAIKDFLVKNRVVLDLMVDDQEETHRFLRDGKVLGCISTRVAPLQGCSVHYLGKVEYSLFCSELFRQKWFPKGISRESVKMAPMILFNRKDELNMKILSRVLGGEHTDYTTFYVPSTELYMDFIVNDLAYGAMPEQQSKNAQEQGLIHDLTPESREHVKLYWHCWNIESELLKNFTKQLQVGFRENCN